MKTIPISEFKSRCCEFLDQVETDREALLVTRRGKPIVEILPPHVVTQHSTIVLGQRPGQATIHGDISKFDFSEDWE
jgi:prevent-host-death family protein